MNAQERQDGLRFILNGLRHSKVAPTHELTSRLTSYMGSEEAAREMIAEAERVGLIEPDGLIPNPTPPEKGWRLSEGFDPRRIEAAA